MAQDSYSRFSINEREFIHKSLAEGKSQKDVALALNRNPSTISREIHRDGMNRNTYSPSHAQKHADQEGLKRKRKYKILESEILQTMVLNKLKTHWSPEQISGVFKREFPESKELHISHEAIYRYIYSIHNKDEREMLIGCLRQSRKRRRPHKKSRGRRTKIRNMVSIHDRSDEAEDRLVPGHWEGDLIIGKDHKSALGTLVERTTRYTIIILFQRLPSSIEATKAFAAALGVLPTHLKRSLTYDRGSEMSAHQWFTDVTGIPVYFADPYSPWQRGTNENTNGLIRDYLPKGTDFSLIEEIVVYQVQQLLNQRPRKKHEYTSPGEMLDWFITNPMQTADDYYASKIGLAI